MSDNLNPDELKRLREAATPGPIGMSKYGGIGAGKFFTHPHLISSEGFDEVKPEDLQLILYLWNHAAELEEALRDRERLEWLTEEQTDTIYMDDGRIVDVKSGSVRAAIDAARKEGV